MSLVFHWTHSFFYCQWPGEYGAENDRYRWISGRPEIPINMSRACRNRRITFRFYQPYPLHPGIRAHGLPEKYRPCQVREKSPGRAGGCFLTVNRQRNSGISFLHEKIEGCPFMNRAQTGRSENLPGTCMRWV